MSSSFLALIWCVSLKGLITRYNKLAFKIKECLHSYLKYTLYRTVTTTRCTQNFLRAVLHLGNSLSYSIWTRWVERISAKKKKNCFVWKGRLSPCCVSESKHFLGVWIDILICVDRVQPSNKHFYFPIKRRILWETFLLILISFWNRECREIEESIFCSLRCDSFNGFHVCGDG